MKQKKFKDLARNRMAQGKMGWVNPALSKERAVLPLKMAGCMNNAG